MWISKIRKNPKKTEACDSYPDLTLDETRCLSCKILQESCKKMVILQDLARRWLSCKILQDEWLSCKIFAKKIWKKTKSYLRAKKN